MSRLKHKDAIIAQLPEPDEHGVRIVLAWTPVMTPSGLLVEFFNWPHDQQAPAVGDQLIVQPHMRIKQFPWVLSCHADRLAEMLKERFDMDLIKGKPNDEYLKFRVEEILGETWAEAMRKSEERMIEVADFLFGLGT